jgi:hypothetical protein
MSCRLRQRWQTYNQAKSYAYAVGRRKAWMATIDASSVQEIKTGIEPVSFLRAATIRARRQLGAFFIRETSRERGNVMQTCIAGYAMPGLRRRM